MASAIGMRLQNLQGVCSFLKACLKGPDSPLISNDIDVSGVQKVGQALANNRLCIGHDALNQLVAGGDIVD